MALKYRLLYCPHPFPHKICNATHFIVLQRCELVYVPEELRFFIEEICVKQGYAFEFEGESSKPSPFINYLNRPAPYVEEL